MSIAAKKIDDLVRRWQAGDAAARDSLLPLVYADLRNLAARKLAVDAGNATMQPTALAHDVIVQLLGSDAIRVADGPHLFNVAAKMMRQMLVDRARRAHADKRGGQWKRTDLIEAMQLPIPEQTDLGLLDAAIAGLERIDPRLARIVELRYFVGLSVPAVAAVLEVDERTVYRDWALAKIWLRTEMEA